MEKIHKIHFKSIDSTNSYALGHIDELEDKTLISADFQTNAHGRFQREWVCSESAEGGNLYLTIVLKPKNKSNISNLTQYLCVVVSKVLEKYGVTPKIKWANDVLTDSGKISGILCEASAKGGIIKGFALGIGVNLNLKKEELKKISQDASSLNLEIGQIVNKKEFSDLLIEEFFKGYEEFLENGFESIKTEYEKRNNFLDKEIYISNNGKKRKYFAKALNSDGSLRVVEANGEEKTIFAGDLSF